MTETHSADAGRPIEKRTATIDLFVRNKWKGQYGIMEEKARKLMQEMPVDSSIIQIIMSSAKDISEQLEAGKDWSGEDYGNDEILRERDENTFLALNGFIQKLSSRPDEGFHWEVRKVGDSYAVYAIGDDGKAQILQHDTLFDKCDLHYNSKNPKTVELFDQIELIYDDMDNMKRK